ncbi:MFS transporter (plasmid) [Legionella sp. D16C41]|uniref:MFS transporter n=1 Tax=Legionella sp. D16C41 TaxID=3402688 RepID=UPI003AF57D5D
MPSGIWALGFVSLLSDIASEMIHSLLPIFMVSVLGASALTVGLMEGIAESTALMVRVFSGAMSDYLHKRKMLAVLGYGIGAISKPMFAIASTVGLVFVARIFDRIGKGIRGAPRDALVADIAPSTMLGAAFGLRQSLDTVGAFIGPLLALVLMIFLGNSFRAVFWVAVIPGILSVVVLWLAVQEPKQSTKTKKINPIHWRELQRLSMRYWWVVVIGGIFTLARFSEAFLLLRAQQMGLAITWMPLILIAMNLIYSISAYPFGKLADMISHNKLLIIGLVILIVADLMLAFGNSLTWVFIGVCLWGLHMGATQGLLATMVADTAPTDLRGTAFGFFSLLNGIAMLIASGIAGLLWDQLGSAFTFKTGALFCLLALLGIAIMPLMKFSSK